MYTNFAEHKFCTFCERVQMQDNFTFPEMVRQTRPTVGPYFAIATL